MLVKVRAAGSGAGLAAEERGAVWGCSRCRRAQQGRHRPLPLGAAAHRPVAPPALPQVHAPPGPARTEVMQIAEIFRAHAVDLSERTLTLQTTGDVGKVRRGCLVEHEGVARWRGGVGAVRWHACPLARSPTKPHQPPSPTASQPEQMEAFKKSLAKFGVVELVRTGRISLKRGGRVFEGGAWAQR